MLPLWGSFQQASFLVTAATPSEKMKYEGDSKEMEGRQLLAKLNSLRVLPSCRV